MAVLHGSEGFVLTPEYDAALAEFVNLNPDHPDPRFDAIERALLVFHWPDSDPPAPVMTNGYRRAKNGQFAKKA